MARLLRWGVALLLVSVLIVGGLLLLPFRSWLPGGTVADIPSGQVVNGSAFNRLFPKPEPGEELVFTQEKRGFSQARLRQGDAVRALLSISDVLTAPEARDKFRAAPERLKGWPLVEQGSQASALLVAERFQVKVIGQGIGMDVQQRHDLLGAFDLRALASLQPTRSARGSLRSAQEPPPQPEPETSSTPIADVALREPAAA